MRAIVLIAMCLLSSYSFAQSLQDEYKVKQDYKNSKIDIDSSETRITINGKKYDIEESYFNLKYAIMKNNDYVCIVHSDGYTFDYLERICMLEDRYKVCLRGGLKRATEYGWIEEIHPAIWILRKH